MRNNADMDYFHSMEGFEEIFISGISPDARLSFLDSQIVFLEENVWLPVVQVLQQGTGSVIVGSMNFIQHLIRIFYT